MNILLESLREATQHSHVSNTKKQHEKWFAKILKSKGFCEKTLEEVGLTTKDIREQLTTCESKVNFYVEQPLGSQNTPDFIVCHGGIIYYIELKSSSKEKITWNGGYPHDGYIYLFSSGTHNAQTVFLGEDAWPADVKQELLDFALSQKERTDKFNETLRQPEKKSPLSLIKAGIAEAFRQEEQWNQAQLNGERFQPTDYKKKTKKTTKQSYYTRNMFSDTEKYYSRAGRKHFEQKVFDFVSNGSGVTNVAAK